MARDWAHLFPVLPHQSEASRRIRWLWGAFEQFRAHLAPRAFRSMTASRSIPWRCRSSQGGEWFYGFHLAIKTDLGSRIVRVWSIVPAAVNEPKAGTDLLEGCPPTWGCSPTRASAGGRTPPGACRPRHYRDRSPAKNQRASMPAILQKVIAQWRNRIEATFGEITDLMELARHGAHTFWGLLTRTAATIAAHTLLRTCLAVA